MQWLQHPGWLLYLTGHMNHKARRTKRVLVTSNVLTSKQHKTVVDSVAGPQGIKAIRSYLACGWDVVAWALLEGKEMDVALRGGIVAMLQLPSLQQRAVLTGSPVVTLQSHSACGSAQTMPFWRCSVCMPQLICCIKGRGRSASSASCMCMI